MALLQTGYLHMHMLLHTHSRIYAYIHICVHRNDQGLESAARAFVESFCICYMYADDSGRSVPYFLATWKHSTCDASAAACTDSGSTVAVVLFTVGGNRRRGHLHLHFRIWWLPLPMSTSASDGFPSPCALPPLMPSLPHVLASLFPSFPPSLFGIEAKAWCILAGHSTTDLYPRL